MLRVDKDSGQAVLDVAVGVIKNVNGQILIALRDEKLHQSGLWEFPGGKIESGETVEQALVRELKEELDIIVQSASPLITIFHSYSDRSVKLHVYTVDTFWGEAKSAENQLIRWVSVAELANYAFPAANQPIIAAVRLPAYYAILDDSQPHLLHYNLKKILDNGISLIQARLKNLLTSEAESFFNTAQALCVDRQATLLINSAVRGAAQLASSGIHLTSQDLMSCRTRPANMQWVAASCHSLEELQHAEKIGADFAVIAPVLTTPTHPDAKNLGWERFAELANQVNLPVYALGGLAKADLAIARQCGAQGIAGIRLFL